MHEMWAIYDTANQSYLTGGNARALEYGRATDPFEAHRYFNTDVASKMLKRLNGEIDKANRETVWHMLPIWNPKEQTRLRKQGDDPEDDKCPVLVQPILEIHHIYSPQIAVVR